MGICAVYWLELLIVMLPKFRYSQLSGLGLSLKSSPSVMRWGAVLVGAIALSGSPALAQTTTDSDTTADTADTPAATDTRFTCQFMDGDYIVMYYPQSQPGEAYPWAQPTELGGGWTPERRCNEISRRLESYRPDGLLELRTGMENGYETVCVTTERNADCRIVLTVPPGQDARLTRDRVFETLTVADSGQQTDAVTTFTGQDDDLLGDIADALGLSSPSSPRRSSDAINLRPFLDPADGGSGELLVPSNAPQLNPDQFR
jgi:hypothetical protein